MLVKPSFNTKRTVLGENLPLQSPYSVILDVSERCNFKCSYCFRAKKRDESWGFAAARSMMSLETFHSAAQQLKAFQRKIKLVSLSGHGEPMTNPHLPDMVQFLDSLDVAQEIDMHTNASLLSNDNIEKFAQAGFTRIVISLQGVDEESYRKTCGAKIDFDQFYTNLAQLYQIKPETLSLHIKIADVALGRGEEYANNHQQFHDLFGRIADHIYVEKTVPIWDNIKIETDGVTNKFSHTTGGTDYCSLVFYKMMVDPDGEIYPCTRLPPPMSLGNISNTSLIEAWQGELRSRFLSDHLCKTRHNHQPCKGCFIPINSITSEKDTIDKYRDVILERMHESSVDA